MPNQAQSSSPVTEPPHQAAANLYALIESTEDLIWSVDLEYRLITFNQALARHVKRWFGTVAAIGKDPYDLLPPARAAIWPPLFQRALDHGPYRAEIPFPDDRTAEMSFNPIVVDGVIAGLSIFGKDITVRKAAEASRELAEKKYRSIFEGAVEGMFQISPDSRLLTANPAFARMFGYDFAQEMIAAIQSVNGELWFDAEEHQRFEHISDTEGLVRGFECRLRRRDGTIFWGSVDCRNVYGDNGELLLHEGFIKDITQRKLAEESLRQSTESLNEAQEIGGLGSYSLDVPSGNWVSSKIMRDLFGIDADYPHTVEGWVGLLHPEDRDRMDSYFANEVLGKKRPFNTEYRIVRPRDGAVRWVLGMGRLDFDAHGQPVRMHGVIKDITDRKLAEQSIIDSQQFTQSTIDALSSTICVLDHCGAIIAVNQSWRAFADTNTKAETESASARFPVPPFFGEGANYLDVCDRTGGPEAGEAASFAAGIRSVLCGDAKQFSQEYPCHSQNEMRWFLGRVTRFEHNSRSGAVIEHIDITALKQGEVLLKETADRLTESEQRYRSTFEQAPVGIVLTSSEGRFLKCNDRFAAVTGYSQDEIAGMTFQQITAPEDLDPSLSWLARISPNQDETLCWEKRYVRKDGSRVWVRITVSAQHDAQGQSMHHIVLVEDIDALKVAAKNLADVQEALRMSESRYRTAFQTSGDAININRLSDGMYVDFNKAFLDIIGFSREEVQGHTSLELGIWADLVDRQSVVDTVRSGAACLNFEARFRRKNGEVFWGVMSASPIEVEGVECVLTITRDISRAKAAEQRLAAAAEALRISEERYRKVFQTSLDSILINRTSDRCFIDVNQAFLDAMGFERDEVIGRTSLDLNLWADPRDLEVVDEMLVRTQECRNVEIQFRKKDGTMLWGLMSASVIEIDGVQCALSITRDISSAKAAEDEIRNLAFYDPLTGLPNRRLLLERLQQTLASSARTGRLRALLFVDLDNFKNLNDTLGHQTGDLLLQDAARRLAACVRETDTVGRLGGDEFVVMLEDLLALPEDAAAQAKGIAEKILASLAQPYMLNGRECRSSASIGISVFGERREISKDILQQADIAMYQAKTAGRNTLRFFAPALQAAVNARATLEEELREAIKTSQFVLYFQPQISRNRLAGVEALIRWNHPGRGVLLPGEFIPLAEEIGLIMPIGNWVLEAACAQIAAWSARRQSANLAVSVNISARQFRMPDFVDQVLGALARTGSNARNLRLELTESMLVENIDEVINKMTELKSHGIRFSLDDFGTGYSSLTYLKRMPLDQLKIDRSFVRDILSDEGSAAIAQTIISLSRAMGLPVIAEGVETEEQREFLSHLGCHAFQGFLFSRALPIDEFQARWLPTTASLVPVAD